MKKIRDLSFVSQAAAKAVLFVGVACAGLGTAGTARAETPAHGQFGLGVTNTLGESPGLIGVFDAGVWHAEATLGLSSANSTSQIELGGHGWFHLHSGASSDFSVGGGLSIDRVDPPGDKPAGAGGGSNATTRLGIDLGFQIRAFVTANVAVAASGGLQVLTGDGDGFVLGGLQPIGAFSFVYFF
jgi:hypothetical protein